VDVRPLQVFGEGDDPGILVYAITVVVVVGTLPNDEHL
jgi:hypothetical protein